MNIPEFKDHFSRQSDIYALYRPEYPDALYEYLASLCKENKLAWDCGCGNGQAAIGLVKYFESVVATDPSESQLEHAREHARIQYKVELAEESGLNDHSTDLVTAANALHTWSATQRYITENQRNPIDSVHEQLYDAWETGPARKSVQWSLILRIGHV